MEMIARYTSAAALAVFPTWVAQAPIYSGQSEYGAYPSIRLGAPEQRFVGATLFGDPTFLVMKTDAAAEDGFLRSVHEGTFREDDPVLLALAVAAARTWEQGPPADIDAWAARLGADTDHAID